MNLNHIILDILDWIRRSLWYQEDAIEVKPYAILQTKTSPFAILKLVQRDTPRAVRTFILTPIEQPSKSEVLVRPDIKDIHICLDHLWTIESYPDFKLTNKTKSFSVSPVRKFVKPEYTHTITVLKASRWVNREGKYSTDIIFSKEYDFLGRDSGVYRDKYATPIITEVASLLLYRPLGEMNWEHEIESSQKTFMGGYFPNKK